MRYAPLLALLLAVPAHAQTDPKTAALDAFLASGGAPRLAAFLDARRARADFAVVAPDGPAAREADWKACEAMLSGGHRDPDGSALRAALAEVPPRQLYFACRIFAATKSLHDELGNGPWGNAKENLGVCTGRKCFERAQTLQSRTQSLENDPAFRGWSDAAVDSHPGEAFEHTAQCYWFRPGREGRAAAAPVVELVADPWDDAFLPARTWFAVHDRATGEALAAAGKDWCGPTLNAVRKPQRDKLIERENKEEERARKVRQLQESFSRMKSPF